MPACACTCHSLRLTGESAAGPPAGSGPEHAPAAAANGDVLTKNQKKKLKKKLKKVPDAAALAAHAADGAASSGELLGCRCTVL